MRSMVARHLQFIAKRKVSQVVGIIGGTFQNALLFGDMTENKIKTKEKYYGRIFEHNFFRF